MKLVDEYLKKDKEYKNKYGEKTFLLYQVGSFFEVYALSKDKNSFENIKNYARICDLTIANKNNIFAGKGNVLMCGFRDYCLEKYIEKTHPHGYTIIVFTQEGPSTNIVRKESAIYSPGTTFLENNSSLSNNMSCIWIQKIKTLHNEQYVFGLSNINLMSGESNICEYYESYYHNPTTYDSIESFLNIYNPVELVLIHNVSIDIIQGIVQFLQIKSKKYHIIDVNNKDHILSVQANRCESQVYQNEIILSFFPQMNVEIFKYQIEDKPISLQSYCFLLNFIRQHNANIIEKIHEPSIQQTNEILLCANHSLKQLNIIHDNGDYIKDNKTTSVIGILNQCKTKMGKRYMNECILNPINNHSKLKKSYSIIEHMLNRNFVFDEYLSDIVDIEKLITKIKVFRITPCDLYDIVKSHQYLDKILKQILKKKDKLLYQEFMIDVCKSNWDSFLEYINDTFNLQICSQINKLQFDKIEDITMDLFKRNISEELDNIIKIKLENKDKLDIILKTIENFFTKKEKKGGDYLKKHQPSSGELCLILTKHRTTFLKNEITKKCKNGNNILYLSFKSTYSDEEESFEFDLKNVYYKDYNKTSCLFCSPIIDQLISSIYNANIQYYEILSKIYKEKVQYIYENYYDHLVRLIQTIRQIDIYNNKTILAKQMNLCKPIIEKEEYSFVDAKKMRHILIEIIETNEIYVPNDICIGKNDNEKGILLYGTNAVGKTSLIKALGICIIMAQSGFYVPCESFIFNPYDYLFTRIIGNDNLFKGLSTFGVEMSELRVILKNCNKKSLILGDELCSGTEIDSALSIFITSLEIMCQKQSSFIFATHFHELQQMKQMKELKQIQCKHMKVQFDYEKQQLFYDRRIHDGQGESIYGLEVCKSLKMDDVFIKRCYEIRNDYIKNKNNVLLMKTSKYNKDKLKHMCEFCNENLATEIHHLQYQKDANQNHYIENSFHKNHSANLASICEICHQHLHALHLRYVKRKTMDGSYELILKKIE